MSAYSNAKLIALKAKRRNASSIYLFGTILLDSNFLVVGHLSEKTYKENKEKFRSLTNPELLKFIQQAMKDLHQMNIEYETEQRDSTDNGNEG